MVFPIVGGDGKPTGYEIDNSMRFNDANANRFQRTPSSAGSRRTFTYSCWVKLSDIGNRSALLHTSGGDNNTNFEWIIHQNGYLMLGLQSFNVFETNMLFRDPSAWYHIVLRMDTTEGSSDNRTKLYVNGNRITSFSATNLNSISQNFDFGVGVSGTAMALGSTASGGDPIGGYMSEINFVDGAALGPDKFGETNDDGVWVPIEPDVSAYGTNGFFLEFKGTGFDVNSDGVGADTSGNDNHHGSTNFATDHITTDTPTNNFATMNSVHKSSNGSAALPTFAEGNLSLTFGADSSTSSTIAPSKGKWYVEYKQGENTADNQGYPIVGISTTLGGTAGDVIGFRTPDSSNYRGQLGTTSVNNAFGSARSANDIFGFYINLDDDILIVHKNGSDYMGSGASSGLDWSGGLTTTNQQTGFYHFYGQSNTNNAFTDLVNFGNPPFSISSSNADANGYGSFEYSPTLSGTAFYAMCSKNLAEYG